MDHTLDNTGLIPYDKAEFMKRSRKFRLEMYGKYNHGGYTPPNFPDGCIDEYKFPNVLACLMWNAAVGEEVDFSMLAVPDVIMMNRLHDICVECAKCDCLRNPYSAPGHYYGNYVSATEKLHPHRKLLKRSDYKKYDCYCSIPKSDVVIGCGHVDDNGGYANGFMRKEQIFGNCYRSEYDITFGSVRTCYVSSLSAPSTTSGVTYRYSPVTEVTGTVPAAMLSGLILMVKADSPARRAAFVAAIDAACVWFGIGAGGESSPAEPPLAAQPAAIVQPVAIVQPAAATADHRAVKEAERTELNARVAGGQASPPPAMPDVPDHPPPAYSQ